MCSKQAVTREVFVNEHSDDGGFFLFFCIFYHKAPVGGFEKMVGGGVNIRFVIDSLL